MPPQLYQTNPFAGQQNDKEIGGEVYELAADAIPAIVEEMKQIEDDEADEEALSEAVKAFVAPTRTVHKRTATLNVVDNVK